MNGLADQVVEQAAGEIVEAIAALAEAVKRAAPGGQDAICRALIEGLRGLTIKAPDVHVTVQPPALTVVAPEGQPIKGWKLTVTGHDADGRIRDLALKPEE